MLLLLEVTTGDALTLGRLAAARKVAAPTLAKAARGECVRGCSGGVRPSQLRYGRVALLRLLHQRPQAVR